MAPGATDAVILGGDIGGTKTHLALYRVADGKLAPLKDRIYATDEFKSLEDACAHFLAGSDHASAACFGVPGPTIDGRAHATNVPWDMDERRLSRGLSGVPVRLINDLGATAYGMLQLPDSEFAILQRGASTHRKGNIAVIAAGTGLGEAGLLLERDGYRVIASEGGHGDFAPLNDEQVELLRFLARELGHVSVERVLSGPGLVNIYRFVAARPDEPEPEWLTARLKSEDPAAVITEVALARKDSRCVRAHGIFVDIYGAEASNLALKVLAIGGVYLGGGIAPKILPALSDGRFIRAFLNKGRLEPLLAGIEVRVSLNQSAALIGAAHLAAAML
jgi:glucokinase